MKIVFYYFVLNSVLLFIPFIFDVKPLDFVTYAALS